MPFILDSLNAALHPREDYSGTGTFNTGGGTVQLGTVSGAGGLHSAATIMVDVRGAGITGSPTAILEGTINGTDYVTIGMFTQGSLIQVATPSLPATMVVYFAEVAGFRSVRLRCITAPTAGTFTVVMRATNSDAIVIAQPIPSTLLATPATAAAGSPVTLNIAAPGLGLFHYLTRVRIELHASTAMAGAAAPFSITTTNLPNSEAYRMRSAIAIGDKDVLLLEFLTNPMKSSVANTATTIVCPVATGGIWFVKAYGYVAA